MHRHRFAQVAQSACAAPSSARKTLAERHHPHLPLMLLMLLVQLVLLLIREGAAGGSEAVHQFHLLRLPMRHHLLSNAAKFSVAFAAMDGSSLSTARPSGTGQQSRRTVGRLLPRSGLGQHLAESLSGQLRLALRPWLLLPVMFGSHSTAIGRSAAGAHVDTASAA
jgi:hypothetical protein